MPEALASNNPARKKRDETMALMRANGATYDEIGGQVGLTKGTVCKVLNTTEAKAIIERETARLMDALPDITANTIQQLQTAKTIHAHFSGQDVQLPKAFCRYLPPAKGQNTTESDEAPQDYTAVPDPALALKYAEMAAKRERDIMMGMGILPSHAQSVVIQQIYNDNRQMAISPDVLRALGGFLGQNGAPSLDSGIIEAEFQGSDLEAEEIDEEGGFE